MPPNQGQNSKLTKVHNRALVLKIIHQNPGISRKDIARVTGLTPASITKIVSELMGKQLVEETDVDVMTGSAGRRPIGLVMNRRKYRIIAVEAGRNSLVVGLFNLSGELMYRDEVLEGIAAIGVSNLSVRLQKMIGRIIKLDGYQREELLAIGISAPGPINAKHGTILDSTNPINPDRFGAPYDWSHVPLADELSQAFNCPVFTDNSGNICALAESWFGSGRGIENFVLYTVGAGIGSGVIIDGLLYRGEDDVVSEIGHVTVDFHGETCTCGNIGCLEMYASFNSMPDYYRQKVGNEPIAVMRDDNRNFIEEVEKIWELAASGDPHALETLDHFGSLLGIGAVTLSNIFSPESIIVSTNDIGDVDPSLLVPSIESYLRAHAFSVIAGKVNIVPSRLGGNIHLFGSVALVLQDLLSVNPIFHVD